RRDACTTTRTPPLGQPADLSPHQESKHMKKVMFVALAFVLSQMPAAPGADPQDDAKLCQGVWLPVEAELAGQKFPAEVLKTLKLTLADGKYTLETPDGADRGTYTLDTSRKPKAMDIKGTDGPNKGKTFLTIYELSGDTLNVCYDLAGKNRPTEFQT